MAELDIKYPFVSTLHQIANTVAVLGAKDKLDSWIANNYIIPLYYKKSDGTYDDYDVSVNFLDSFLTTRFVHSLAYCPYFEYSKVETKMLEQYSFDSIIDFIKVSIDSGQYMHLYLDQSKIKHSDVDVIHPVFIYGYDDSEAVVYAADFFKNSKYMLNKLPYEEVLDAACFGQSELTGMLNSIGLFRYIDCDYGIDLNHIKRSLNDYINCSDSTNKLSNYRKFVYYYGLDLYEMVCQDFEREHFEIKHFHIIYDHKVMNKRRLEVLKDYGYLKEEDFHRLLPKAEELEKISLRLRNSFLKLLVLQQMEQNYTERKQSIKNSLDDLKKLDYQFCVELIEALG